MRLDWSYFGGYKIAVLLFLVALWVAVVAACTVIFQDSIEMHLHAAEMRPFADFKYFGLILQGTAPVTVPFILGAIIVAFAFIAITSESKD